MRKAILVLSLLLLATGVAWAQVQTESLGDGARRIRAERAKKNLSKVPMFTNDNIPAGGEINIAGATGTASAAPTPSGGEAELEEGAAAGPEKEKECDEQCWRGKFRAKREEIQKAGKDLEFTQREYNLARQQYYQDPNQAVREQYSNNPAGGRQLQELLQKMNDLKAKIEQLKRELSALEDDLRQKGGEPGWARE